MAKTSLSAGAIIRNILVNDESVMAIANKVFPVVVDNATLPYVAYRRSRLEHNPSKAGSPGADAVHIDVNCYASTYQESIELAEAVRSALDYANGETEDICMRGCRLSDASETYEDDAFVQSLIFEVRI